MHYALLSIKMISFVLFPQALQPRMYLNIGIGLLTNKIQSGVAVLSTITVILAMAAPVSGTALT